MRARPESITAVTPSIVTDDSATFVDRMILRRSPGRTARVCSSSGISPCSGSTAKPPMPGHVRERRLGALDLAGARQEHQHVAVLVVAQHAAHRARHLRGQRPIVGRGQVLDRDVEHAALAADDVAAEEVGDRIGVERRGHRHHGQIGPVGLAQAAQPGEREIGRDVALVELVEHDGADAGQPRRGQQPPDEQALGHEAEPRVRSARLVEAHRVADRLADALAQLARDAGRGQPGGQPPRLEHPDLAGAPAASSSARGTRVVLPAPGGASTTAAPRAATAAAIAGRQSSIGSGCSATAGYNAPAPASIEVNELPFSDLERDGARDPARDRVAPRAARIMPSDCVNRLPNPVISDAVDISADQVRVALFYVIAFVVSVSVHEFGHAFVADRLGDRIPRLQGRLTLSPIAHIDPVGTLAVPLLGALVAGLPLFAWGKPVQTNPANYTRRFSTRTGSMLVAAAGPFMNLVLAVVGSIVIVMLGTGGRAVADAPARADRLRRGAQLRVAVLQPDPARAPRRGGGAGRPAAAVDAADRRAESQVRDAGPAGAVPVAVDGPSRAGRRHGARCTD